MAFLKWCSNTCRLLVLLVLPLVVHGADREQLILTVDDHPLTVWVKRASKERAVVLLLHGRTWSSLPNFDLQVPGESLSFMDGLNERGLTAYALDARGYGASERDSSGWLTPDRAARDVAAVLAEISSDNGNQVHLFGWSYGAMVAQLVVQRAPASAASVTLFGYPFNPDRHVPKDSHRYPEIPPAKRNTASAAASDFIVPGAISERAVKVYVAAALKADPVRVDFRGLRQWSELDPAAISTPLLVIHGQADPLALLPQQSALMVQSRSSAKRWVILSGGAHAALLETPRQEMLDALAQFVLTNNR